MPDFVGIVLAAGQGTRMKSTKPKVLHEIAGRPLAAWTVQAALDAGASRCVVVVGHGREEVEATLRARFGERVQFAHQAEQLGTGHAVRCAVEAELQEGEGHAVVLYGDCPAIHPETLERLVAAAEGFPFALITASLANPKGYGRILRNDAGNVVGIREDKDCSAEERAIREVNPGLYAIELGFLREALGKLDANNAQGELYLTDLAEMAAGTPRGVVDVPGDMGELRGINDRWELSVVGRTLRERILERLARSGVGIVDPATTFVDADCEVEADATIAPGVHLRGRCVVRAGARIDVGCVLEDVEVAPGAWLKPYTVAAESQVGRDAQVGPFAHLRPKSDLGEGSKVGNFCETKKTRIGKGSKVNHLAYVGDGMIGERVNIGAGVIFCNYDGVQKHVTTLEDDVFIGSDSQLVAPVTIGAGAYVGSGSTITGDVPADALAIARVRKQTVKEGFASRLRERFAAAKKAKAEE
ncbi:MAG TPA: bifunctional UDP-N-acetylglucosamine diphosphorylase/glucosamine-1-phosphate N-acetyltransferase GlmU [Polyangiaceae bacterium LLY-WYZ-15_(1-7)]|nr:UDP-N-acetylglucosamine diphosphorylase/glucosamine-1-phosphate N-acetyltransferase [Myxococcales bacterium]MAT27360.1 UDP-N-acetylglucosamine diphosphorylase/glucosamine-1-phosphate N-acetyltransferase [Sandaracinus sp.]HJK91379.1 bifunctional UDP-N-acetylglucosamine diphosphorylase/glucosamine-1-phosphate N-acetyltransferase GlmU [Polyangiaceae bacterium LLY-WYZ-15_(1-7)]MBJ72504.1 UDP-N-acetylglucosamine diphosphorylase/glucosamine-1-phosphate N-acetyltransferase [Sandaracinus sp.]HJL0480